MYAPTFIFLIIEVLLIGIECQRFSLESIWGDLLNGRNNGNNEREFRHLPTPPKCGQSDVQSGRIVGGQASKAGSWPWIVALGYRNDLSDSTEYICGGVLISELYVMTAAHCVVSNPNFKLDSVRLGDLNLNGKVNDGVTPIEVPVQRVIVHHLYNSSELINDIALIKLQKNVTFPNTITPICLPTTAEMINQKFEKTRPTVAGWGTQRSAGPRTTELREVQVPVVNNEECEKAYNGTTRITLDHLCAGQGGKDACQGDSGGPLMYFYRRAWYSVGIVSFGRGCALKDYPGVYTRVTSFMPWIGKNME